jgi:uncharacterized protein (DUF1778 family)
MPPKRKKKPGKDAPKEIRKEVRKESSIQLRVTFEQKELLKEVAKKRGLALSSWMLATCLEAAEALKARAAETKS